MHVMHSEKPEKLDQIMRNHAKEVAEHGKSLAAESGIAAPRAFVKARPVARTITGFAKERGYDLIVMGSRGLGSLEGSLLGSVSHKVTSLAETPVLIV